MSPIRILIIAILFYIGYRLIVGGKKKKPTREIPKNDVLVEDPVCKKLVPKQQAIVYEAAGETHYFCSKKCCNVYRNQNGEQQ